MVAKVRFRWRRKIFGMERQAKKTAASTYILESDADADIRQDVFNFAVQHGLAVLAMQVKQKSMEDVFRELTNR